MNNETELLRQVHSGAGMMPRPMQMGGMVETAPDLQQELAMIEGTADSPEEKAQFEKMEERAMISAQSELAGIAEQLAAMGRGGDTTLAHLTPGEVVLPPQMFEDEQFESAVENRFKQLDLNPEEYVVGMGIASLNPSTGLEEFGFFKKLGKSIKKFAKKIAPVAGPLANLIPGVGPIVAGAIGAATNVVGGKGLKGAIGGALGGYGTGKLLGGIGSLGNVSGTAVKGLEGGFSNLGFIDKLKALGTGARAGIGSLFGGTLGGATGGLPGGMTQDQYLALSDADKIKALEQAGISIDDFQKLAGQGVSVDEIFKQLGTQGSATGTGSQGNFFSRLISGGGADDKGQFGLVGDILGGGLGGGQGGLGSLLGGGLGGGLAAGGIGALIGKLAYDEAKNRRGVPRTPLTQMDAFGRFNIAQAMERERGGGKIDPREFGLLPAGTFPQLSGGKPPMQRQTMTAANGGAVRPMAYAKGGGVAMEDFERMNGEIDGPGTETSDDIPAMLSDGEFVMKSQAVRGAGAFDMKNQGGIITLTPNKEEDRERGTQLMYDMMNLFSEFAGVRK
tara:strand:- start:913 stop:2598 length:1686 start_codon:yes stop_codon:yes gene_type:complete